MPLPPLCLGFLVGAGVWVPLPETSINLVPVPGINHLPLRYFSFWATEVSSRTSQGPGCNFLVLGERKQDRSLGGWVRMGPSEGGGQGWGVGSVGSLEDLGVSKEGT